MLKNYCYFLLGLFPFVLSAQDPEPLWCHQLTLLDGLTSDEYNFHVYCDSEDFVWISSTKGLNRFDGQQIKTYHGDFNDSTKLYGENIQSKMYEDAKGDIWFCTYKAIHCYKRETDEFRHYFVKDSNGNRIEVDYQVFHLEQDKYLWFRAGNNKDKTYNVYRVDITSSNKAFAESQPLFRSSHYHLFVGVDTTGAVQEVFSCSGKKPKGLEHFSRAGNQFIKRSSFDEKDANNIAFGIFEVYFEAPNAVWLSTTEGIKRWNLKNSELNHFPFSVKDFLYMAELDSNHFLVSIFGKGVFIFDKTTGNYRPYTLRSIASPGASLDNATRNIYLDKNKVLWITRVNHGLAFTHLQKRKFNFLNNVYTNDESIHYKELISLEDGTFLAVHQKGWYQMDTYGNVMETLDFKGIMTVKTACVEGEELLFGTGRGIYACTLKTKKWYAITGTEDLILLDMLRLNEHEKILVSTLGTGLYWLFKREGEWKIEKVGGDAPGENYSHIFQNNSGDIFLCDNDAKIDVFTLESDTLRKKEELAVRGSVYHYYEDEARGLLWIGTSFGLVKVTTKDLQVLGDPYDIRNGLSDNSIFTIIPDAQNQLWLSTFRGLCLFDPAQESAHAFSMADGTLSEQFRNGVALKQSDGSIWLGGSRGITVLGKDPISFLDKRPEVLITDFRIDGAPPGKVTCAKTKNHYINRVQQLEYGHTQNSLSFEFAATDYADPKNTRLRYKLEEVDGVAEKWQETKAGERAVARYRNLPHGHYQLSIEAINSDGVDERSSMKVIGITILPRVWERAGFWIAVLVLTLVFSYLFYRWRLQVKLEKEALKTKIAINEMQALLGQMKPHFIFNSLNSINRMFLTGEKKQASEYLGRFSGLIRMMLENSRSTMHSLETEIKFLTLYMKVESQRFKVPFSYEIIVDEHIDPSILEIPTMMLQPFVENAIWHGVSHRLEGGHVKVVIQEKGNLLQCIIEDNGVGREAASIIAEQRGKKTHQSRAISIVEDRLGLLFPNQKYLCKVVYEDVRNEEGSVAGTRVLIELPG